MVWTNLFGVISFELYGQLHQVVGGDPAIATPSSPSASAAGSTFTGIAYARGVPRTTSVADRVWASR